MLAATDGHAKNFSLRLLPQGRYHLTPLYDVVSLWPAVGRGNNQYDWHKAKPAMAVVASDRHYLLKDVQRRHFNAMAGRFFQRESAEDLIADILQRVPAAIDAVTGRLPKGFPDQVASAVIGGLHQSAEKLGRMPSSLQRS